MRRIHRPLLLRPPVTVAAATVWDLAGATSNYAANPTFWTASNSSRTVTMNAVANVPMCVRGTTAKTSGKWYFEVAYAITGTTTTNIDFGVISSAASMTDNYQTGSGKGDMTARNNGQVFSDGVANFIASTGTWANGDVIGLACDVGTNVQVYRNNTLLTTVTLATASIKPYMAFETVPTTVAGTLNTSAAQCSFAPPSGYANWD